MSKREGEQRVESKRKRDRRMTEMHSRASSSKNSSSA